MGARDLALLPRRGGGGFRLVNKGWGGNTGGGMRITNNEKYADVVVVSMNGRGRSFYLLRPNEQVDLKGCNHSIKVFPASDFTERAAWARTAQAGGMFDAKVLNCVPIYPGAISASGIMERMYGTKGGRRQAKVRMALRRLEADNHIILRDNHRWTAARPKNWPVAV